MHEILSRTKGTEPLSEKAEFYELRLIDYELRSSEADFAGRPAFGVKKARAQWDYMEQAIAWDVPELWIFENLLEAEGWYRKQRLALAARGLIYSDLEW
jgi:hypothetical protein